MVTDTTFDQLAATTGVKVEYIRSYFIPKLKIDGYIRCETQQAGYKKRNTYYLPNLNPIIKLSRQAYLQIIPSQMKRKGLLLVYTVCV